MKTEYIANCIKRILDCRCRIDRSHQRMLDIAEAVTIAGQHDEDAGHKYLHDLLFEAENGKYDK